MLVVEDEAPAREVITDTLEAAGYRAIPAADGVEARGCLDAERRLPCVILLDLMMPRCTGWEFREWQRQEPRFASVPVVLVSASMGIGDEARKLGVADWLSKPVAFPSLLALVEKHCGPC